MDGSAEEEFRRFVVARLHSLRGLAYLTCGNWQAAEDAAASTLEKLYCRWEKVSDPERYAARMVVRAAIDQVRRPWPQRRWMAAARHQRRDAGAARPAQPSAGGVEQYIVHRGHPVQPQHVLRDLDQDGAARREPQDPRHRRQRRESNRGEEPQRREHQQVADDLAPPSSWARWR